MNDKFEDWFREQANSSESYYDARLAWKESIQSLEVTDELQIIACDAYHGTYGGIPSRNGMRAALVAVLSALKEQANG